MGLIDQYLDRLEGVIDWEIMDWVKFGLIILILIASYVIAVW